jgi:hypothetical protein
MVDAERQLVKDFIDEIELVASKQTQSFKVHAGRHPTLGKVVVIEGPDGNGIIVEVE